MKICIFGAKIIQIQNSTNLHMKNIYLFAAIAGIVSACQPKATTSAAPEAVTTVAPSPTPATPSPATNTGGKMELLPVAEFRKQVEATPNAQLIDVRTPAEVAQGALPNAKNVDFRAPNFKEELAKLDKTKPLYIYCQRGGRSASAAQVANELGFQHVIDMEGGYEAYTAK